MFVALVQYISGGGTVYQYGRYCILVCLVLYIKVSGTVYYRRWYCMLVRVVLYISVPGTVYQCVCHCCGWYSILVCGTIMKSYGNNKAPCV